MKKKIIFLFTMIIVILMAPSIVIANNTSGGSSVPSAGWCSESVSGCSWNYPGSEQSFAVRLSLYHYDGKNLKYYGSVNYCANGENTSCLTYEAYQTSDKAGKIAYQKLNKNASWNTFGKISKSTSIAFPRLMTEGGGNGNWDAIEAKVKEAFSLNNYSGSKILNDIKREFENGKDLTQSDIGNLYITIEPALLFKSPQGYYYGTAYEIAYWLNQSGNGRAGSVTDYLYKYLPSSIVAKRQNGEDRYSFVGNLVQITGDSLSINRSVWGDDRTLERQLNTQDILSQKGFGINVFWLGNYAPTTSCTVSEATNKRTYTLKVNNGSGDSVYYDINSNVSSLKNNVKNDTYYASYKDQNIIGKVYNSSGNEVATCTKERSIPTCSQTCSGKSGDDLLGCAEDYCQNMSDNSSEKRTCITTCGYSDPGFSTCSNTDTSNGKNTVCDEDTTASKTTCTVANKTNYYKTVCTETTTIEYGNSLPVTLLPGTGFTYTPVVKGNKICTMTFEANKWKFDYAASYTASERSTLVNKLNQFNNVSKDSVWAKDINNIYKYKSDDADITIEITNNNDAGASNNKTTKKLIADKTVNLLDEEVEVSSGGTTNVAMFNGNKRTTNIFSIIKTNSSNKTSYKLPGICMNGGTGTLYDLKNGRCNSSNDGPYYEYYTNLKTKIDRYPTTTTVSKTSSGLGVVNTCEYNVDIPVSCAVIKNNNTYELKIENKNGVTGIRYGLSLNRNELNDKDTYIGSLVNKQLYGTVAVNGKIIATCKNSDNSNCNDKYQPSQYSEIKDYCSKSWMEDKANYASEKDCVSSCSTGSNTCKNNPNVDTNNIESVTNFCSSKTNRDNNGYNKIAYTSPELNEKYNIAMCINDCMDLPKNNECLGITCDYLYRPISLKDPFPNNRRPGYNWYGKEIFITDDLLNPLLNSNGANPEYVISLTPDRIEAINKDTDNYNSNKGKNAYIDYVYNNDNNTSGKYISKFIHSNDEANGGFKRYFTMIESVSN